MTNAELVRQLRTASVQCDEMRLRDFGYLFKTAADKIDELLNSVEMLDNLTDMLMECVPQWIPVTERLPRDRQSVLVYCGDNNRIRPSDRFDVSVLIGDKVFTSLGVTHWMPLPNPPEKGTEE